MPETMFQKFFTGNYNARSLGTPFVRKLTESRGVKEGNNAFVKDSDTLTFATSGPSSHHLTQLFFRRLFDLGFEHGSSLDLFDFVLAKWAATDAGHYTAFIYDRVIEAILFGHRKLGAHILDMAPNGYCRSLCMRVFDYTHC